MPGPDGRCWGVGGGTGGDPARDGGRARAFDLDDWPARHGHTPGLAASIFPLLGSQSALGVLAVRPRKRFAPLTPVSSTRLRALARQARLGPRTRAPVSRDGTERLRNTLLRSVSHDLRRRWPPSPARQRAAPAHTIGIGRGARVEGGHLRRGRPPQPARGTNLLDMTRLESGLSPCQHRLAVRSRRSWVRRWPGSTAAARGAWVAVSIPADLPWCPDAVLMAAGAREPSRQCVQVHGADRDRRSGIAAGACGQTVDGRGRGRGHGPVPPWARRTAGSRSSIGKRPDEASAWACRSAGRSWRSPVAGSGGEPQPAWRPPSAHSAAREGPPPPSKETVTTSSEPEPPRAGKAAGRVVLAVEDEPEVMRFSCARHARGRIPPRRGGQWPTRLVEAATRARTSSFLDPGPSRRGRRRGGPPHPRVVGHAHHRVVPPRPRARQDRGPRRRRCTITDKAIGVGECWLACGWRCASRAGGGQRGETSFAVGNLRVTCKPTGLGWAREVHLTGRSSTSGRGAGQAAGKVVTPPAPA